MSGSVSAALVRDVLSKIYGTVLAVRPPVPATLNKAGANYKSEVQHLEYSPRNAYDEWLAICEGILEFGGDAIFDYEPEDDPLLDAGALVLDPDGWLHAEGSRDRLAKIDDVLTGRVFAANGPWVVTAPGVLRALMPNMLAHRQTEGRYYRGLLERVAESTGRALEVVNNPHRWEGMADVAACGDKVVLTYTVEGNYDRDVGKKTSRSSRAGVEYAADFAEVAGAARIFAELIYPHFHGDTVHFGARPASGGAKLVHYPGGLFGDGAERVAAAVERVLIDREDAVEKYAGNSRQVAGGVLVPDGVSAEFIEKIEALGLSTRRVPLFELFGKAGGGPACATLYLPTDLDLPEKDPLRYSQRRSEAQARRMRYAERLTVNSEYFRGKQRG
jgi:hypothetical protein